jgi:hypothetical protein
MFLPSSVWISSAYQLLFLSKCTILGLLTSLLLLHVTSALVAPPARDSRLSHLVSLLSAYVLYNINHTPLLFSSVSCFDSKAKLSMVFQQQIH